MDLVALKSVLHTLLMPTGLCLLLAVPGLALIGRRRALGLTLVSLGVGLLWVCATPVIADGLTGWAERCPPLDLSRPITAQAIVILGGGYYREHAPEFGGAPAAEEELLERLNYGAFLARRTRLPLLVTGNGAEAITMRATLERDFGLQVRWMDAAARDTFENAGNSARLLASAGITSVILVTSSTHEWRAVQEYADTGLTVVPAPTGMLERRSARGNRFVPSVFALHRSSGALYELIGERVRQLLRALHLRRHAPA